MKKNRLILLIFSFLLAVLPFSSCTGLKNVRPVSLHLESIEPRGFHDIGMKIALGVENPSVQFTVKEAELVLKKQGKEVARIVAEPLVIRRKTTDVYPVDLALSLPKGTFTNTLLSFLQKNISSSDEYTADVMAKVKLKCGPVKTFRKKNVPLNAILKQIRL